MTKCIHNPVRECEYADCKNCLDYDDITDRTPYPDELFEIEREEKLYG